MRYLNTKLILFSVALMLSATASFALPNCPSDQTKRYHNCFGTYTWPNGEKYVGEWENGERHGYGKFSYFDGDVYVGEWRLGQHHGHGSLTRADGTKSIGEWKKGIFVDK